MSKAIMKQSIDQSAAVITKNSSWIGMYRFRMSNADRDKYPPFNFLTIYNKSSQDAEIRFGTGNEGGNPVKELPSNSAITINIEDGIQFYDFDVMNLDAATDIATSSIKGFAMVVAETKIEK